MLIIATAGLSFLVVVVVVVLILSAPSTTPKPPSQPSQPSQSSQSSQTSQLKQRRDPKPRIPLGAVAAGDGDGGGAWKNATLTCFEESHNFASENTDPTKQNVVAVLARDFREYKNRRLQLRLPTGVHSVEVRDECAASAPECTKNAAAFGNNFLIDINGHALRRLWPGKSCGDTYQTVQFR